MGINSEERIEFVRGNSDIDDVWLIEEEEENLYGLYESKEKLDNTMDCCFDKFPNDDLSCVMDSRGAVGVTIEIGIEATDGISDTNDICLTISLVLLTNSGEIPFREYKLEKFSLFFIIGYNNTKIYINLYIYIYIHINILTYKLSN